MSHILFRHVTHVIQRPTNHVTHGNEPCHTRESSCYAREWVMSHTWMSHVLFLKKARVWRSDVTHSRQRACQTRYARHTYYSCRTYFHGHVTQYSRHTRYWAVIQGGEDSKDPLSLYVIFRKNDLYYSRHAYYSCRTYFHSHITQYSRHTHYLEAISHILLTSYILFLSHIFSWSYHTVFTSYSLFRGHITHITHATHITGWQRPIGCLKLQVIFRKRVINYRALLRKMTY